MGYPTVNLVIPADLVLEDGVYAAWVEIDSRTYKGALHYGPVPTFEQKDKSLEVHLLDVSDDNFPETDNKDIIVDIVELLRPVDRFASVDELVEQISRDVEKTRLILG
jgi:riboflavin kinase/FMN adenylyltransferase